jgi:hypothetical protein
MTAMKCGSRPDGAATHREDYWSTRIAVTSDLLGQLRNSGA